MTTNSIEKNPALSGSPLLGFLSYAIPSLLGLLAMSTASVIDGIFIGRHGGSEALAAVNLMIPVFGLFFGMAYMLAVGGSVQAGRYVGERDFEAASNLFSKTLIATLGLALVLFASGRMLSEELFGGLGASPSLFPSLHAYFDILIWFLPVQMCSTVLYFFVRIAGHPTLAASALALGAVSNILLDYGFITVMGKGLAGAAFATGLSSLITLATLLSYRLKPERWLEFRPLQSRWGELFRASLNGLSEFVNEISGGLVAFVLNLILLKELGVDGVAAFSVVSYGMYIGLLLSFSLADTLQVLSSQCFGARDEARLRQFFTIASVLSLMCAFVFIGLLTQRTDQLLAFFVGEEQGNLLPIAREFIGVLWPVFLFNGLNVVISAYLTAVQELAASAAVALLRSLILPLALLALGTYYLPNYPFLLALPVSEALTLLVALSLFSQSRPSQKVYCHC